MKPVILTVVVCLAAGACARKSASTGAAYVSEANFQGWSCDQLSREVARTDASFAKGQKNAIEQVMLNKNCIYPLAAATE